MGTQEAKVRLAGRWRLVRKFSAPGGSPDRNTRLFNDQDYIVEFSQEGNMVERCNGVITTTMYHFDPDTRVITIQPTDRTPSSPLSGIGNAPFRVIPLTDGAMYFVRPHTVDTGDEDADFVSLLLERI